MTSEQGRILVVDDNKANRKKISFVVKNMGHTVEMAQDGRQALAMLRDKPFDIVLLDVLMPEMDGYQVLEQIKADETLHDISVIVVSAARELSSMVKAIKLGAEDYLTKDFDPVVLEARIGASLEKKRLGDQKAVYLQQVQREKKRSDDLLHVVMPLGAALSVEKDFNHLLENIVLGGMMYCHTDGGTMYLRTDDDQLEFVIVRNDSLNIRMGGTSGQPISFPRLRLYDEKSGQPNHHNIVTHVVLDKTSINIPDVYDAEDFDFSGTKVFDARTGYRTTSCLTIPLKNSLNHVIGVLQLINALEPETGQVIPFDPDKQQMMEGLSLLATVALESYIREQGLREEIQQLRIELNEARKAQQVNQITGTDYFKQLRSKAGDLRNMLVEEDK